MLQNCPVSYLIHVSFSITDLLLQFFSVFSKPSVAFLFGQHPGRLHTDVQTFVETAALTTFTLKY